MHDLAYFRSHFDLLSQRLATRGNLPSLDQFRELDQKRRAAISQAEQLKARANAESVNIGKLKREGAATAELQEQVRKAYNNENARLNLALRDLHARALEKLVSIAKGEGVLLPGDVDAANRPNEVLVAR